MKKVLMSICLCALIVTAVQVQSNATTWTGGRGNWSTRSNWDDDEPRVGVNAFIDNGGTALITLSGEGANDLILGTDLGLSGYVSMSGGTLSANNESIGLSGTGTFTQTGGSNTLTGLLGLGTNSGSSGTYNLNGGVSLSAFSEYIGNAGTGAFTQTGGTNTATHDLILGVASGGSGTYDLVSGALSANFEIIGESGTGVFTQTSGTNTLTNDLILGVTSGGSRYIRLGLRCSFGQ